MATVLIIRNLSEESNTALELYKQEHSLRSNTDAAEAMMMQYHGLLSERDHWKTCYLNASTRLARIMEAHDRKVQASDDFERILQGQETKAEEQARLRKEADEERFRQRNLELAKQREEIASRYSRYQDEEE